MSAKNQLPTRPVGRFQLKLGLWLVTHRLAFKRLLVAVLGATVLGLYGYTVAVVVGLARGQAAYREMMRSLGENLIDYPALRPLYSAQPLQISPPQVLPAGGDAVDVAVSVVNPNEKFAVPSLSLRFLNDGQVIGSVTGFLFPGERKRLFSLGVKKPAGTVQVELAEVNWRRIVPAEFNQLRADRLQLEIIDVKHARGDQLGGLAQRIAGQTSFTVVNRNTVFGYWDVGLYVLLMNGDQVAAVNFSRVRRLDTLQRQPVTVSWAQTLPLTTAVQVVPEVNLFSPETFFVHRVPDAVPR